MKEFFYWNGKKKVSPPWIANFQMLISHWSRIFFLKKNPSAFQNGKTLENQVKIGVAMSKNVWSSVPTALKCKNFGGLLGAPKNGF